MNKSLTLIIIGVALLVLGIAAGVFRTTQSSLFGLYTTLSTPYSAYMIPLLIGGIILIVVGAVVGKKE